MGIASICIYYAAFLIAMYGSIDTICTVLSSWKTGNQLELFAAPMAASAGWAAIATANWMQSSAGSYPF